jgi:ribonuclease E
LGVAVPAEPVKPAERPSRREEQSAGKPSSRDVSSRERPRERDRHRGRASKDVEQPREQIRERSADEWDAETIEVSAYEVELSKTDAFADADEPTAGEQRAARGDEEQPGRRRRRRRRGGRRSKRDRGEQQGQEAGSERDAGREPESADESEDLVDFEPLDEAAPSTAPEGAEPEERRGRNKRRRRRGSGSDREGRKSERPSKTDAALPAAKAFDEDEPSLEIDSDEEEIAAEGSSDKNSHRAIPSWEEAIGYIVSVNMEARAKNPRAPQSRGGRGRGRGGRGNSRGNGRRK